MRENLASNVNRAFPRITTSPSRLDLMKTSSRSSVEINENRATQTTPKLAALINPFGLQHQLFGQAIQELAQVHRHQLLHRATVA